jgi:hypothetical protein
VEQLIYRHLMVFITTKPNQDERQPPGETHCAHPACVRRAISAQTHSQAQPSQVYEMYAADTRNTVTTQQLRRGRLARHSTGTRAHCGDVAVGRRSSGSEVAGALDLPYKPCGQAQALVVQPSSAHTERMCMRFERRLRFGQVRTNPYPSV